MKRADAQNLIGQPVSAWTAANGTYVGTLEEVIVNPGSPWRARVRITGVLSSAHHHEKGRTVRKGFRIGQEIEVGGINVEPTDQIGTTYRQALEHAISINRDQIATYEAMPENSPARRYEYAVRAALKSELEVLEKVLQEDPEADPAETLESGDALRPGL